MQELEGAAPNYGRFVGKLVKVVFKEPGAPVETKKGQFVSYDGNFVELRTHEHTYLISCRSIIAIKIFGQGLGG
ncbi:MAG: hypothetical protein QW835_02595 [Candidatus Hadarchaeum sp.]|uniref:hypothetical protein n=1 Tax=Candidatus Hadarchaeum sp. TaxID=2883567 RepID=UPI00317E1508